MLRFDPVVFYPLRRTKVWRFTPPTLIRASATERPQLRRAIIRVQQWRTCMQRNSAPEIGLCDTICTIAPSTAARGQLRYTRNTIIASATRSATLEGLCQRMATRLPTLDATLSLMTCRAVLCLLDASSTNLRISVAAVHRRWVVTLPLGTPSQRKICGLRCRRRMLPDVTWRLRRCRRELCGVSEAGCRGEAPMDGFTASPQSSLRQRRSIAPTPICFFSYLTLQKRA